MRHDTSTTPSAAVNSTPLLSARIEAPERGLNRLYLQRRGQKQAGDWRRCASSGCTSVFPANGEDTCQACVAGSAGDRSGTRP
jgi:hypothetical protein